MLPRAVMSCSVIRPLTVPRGKQVGDTFLTKSFCAGCAATIKVSSQNTMQPGDSSSLLGPHPPFPIRAIEWRPAHKMNDAHRAIGGGRWHKSHGGWCDSESSTGRARRSGSAPLSAHTWDDKSRPGCVSWHFLAESDPQRTPLFSLRCSFNWAQPHMLRKAAIKRRSSRLVDVGSRT